MKTKCILIHYFDESNNISMKMLNTIPSHHISWYNYTNLNYCIVIKDSYYCRFWNCANLHSIKFRFKVWEPNTDFFQHLTLTRLDRSLVRGFKLEKVKLFIKTIIYSHNLIVFFKMLYLFIVLTDIFKEKY